MNDNGKPKTALARLRKELRLSRPEMAYYAGCNTATYREVELGRRKMTKALASKVAERTGASFDWIIKNDPDLAIRGRYGDFDPRWFVGNRLTIKRGMKSYLLRVRCEVAEHLSQYLSVILWALEKDEFELCQMQMRESLRAVEKFFAPNLDLRPLPVLYTQIHGEGKPDFKLLLAEFNNELIKTARRKQNAIRNQRKN